MQKCGVIHIHGKGSRGQSCEEAMEDRTIVLCGRGAGTIVQVPYSIESCSQSSGFGGVKPGAVNFLGLKDLLGMKSGMP